MNIIITGSEGFIGKHLVRHLEEQGHTVTGVDLKGKPLYNILAGDPRGVVDVGDFSGADMVYHLAAQPDVRRSMEEKAESLRDIDMTFRVLETMRRRGAKRILFTSSSAVYGNADVVPTPESAPVRPVSIYAVAKTASEDLINAYCCTYGMSAWSLRFGNIVGAGCHGVIPDFIAKLRANPNRLEILGDGNQRRGYVHVVNLLSIIDNVVAKWNTKAGQMQVMNVAARDAIPVRDVAECVFRRMKVSPKIVYTGGKTGWAGDLPVAYLTPGELQGDELTLDSEYAVDWAVKDLLAESRR